MDDTNFLLELIKVHVIALSLYGYVFEVKMKRQLNLLVFAVQWLRQTYRSVLHWRFFFKSWRKYLYFCWWSHTMVTITSRVAFPHHNICIFIFNRLRWNYSILVAVYISMQNVYQSCDLGRALGRSNVDISQKCSLFTDVCVMLVAYRHDIKRRSAASWLLQDLRLVWFNCKYQEN